MQVEFLGTAGYHPNASRHTSCTYIPEAAPGVGFLLDAGTGMFRLIGRDLPAELHIFLSHAHLDHVSGLTYLLNILLGKTTQVTIYGNRGCLDTISNHLFDSPLFPLPLTHRTVAITPGQPVVVQGVRVTVFPLTHPGGSDAYRLDWSDRSLAYVTDTAGDGRYVDFISDADLLIHERNFSDSLHEVAVASGHCTSEEVLRVTKLAHVKQLVLTHFNPLTQHDPLDDDSLRVQCPGAISAEDGLIVTF